MVGTNLKQGGTNGNKEESSKEESSKEESSKEEKEISSLHPQMLTSLGWGRNSPAPSKAAVTLMKLNFQEKFKNIL